MRAIHSVAIREKPPSKIPCMQSRVVSGRTTSMIMVTKFTPLALWQVGGEPNKAGITCSVITFVQTFNYLIFY